jgi:hypothetical protein
MSRADFKVIENMHLFGGSFVYALARAATKADPENLAKIKATWPEIWEKYANWETNEK